MEPPKRIRKWRIAFALAVGVLAGPAQRSGARAEQNARKVLLAETFERSEGGWVAFGGGDGRVRITPDVARIKAGRPALALDYIIAPKQFSAAVLPVAEGSLSEMGSLSFWLKTDAATPVAVFLSEKKPGGGNYAAVVWSPKDTWQRVELSPADFSLTEGPNDPKDADGKLDLDQVEGIGILDIGQMFAGVSENPSFPIAVEKRSGAHSLYIDQLEATANAAPALAASGQAVVIDDFHRDHLNWLTPGGAELALSKSGNPLARPALEARYTQDADRHVVILHPLAQTSLGKAQRLELDIASERSAQIILSIEARKPGRSQGPRYNTAIDVPGGRQPVHKTISLADFNFDENGPSDPAGHLDLTKVKNLVLVDITASEQASQKNTLWVANLRAEGALGGRTTQTQTQHAHDMASMPGMDHDLHEMPATIGHNENSHVTESMSSHHMREGPHMKLTELRPVSADDLKKADEIVNTLRASIQKYTDYRLAIKDGYLPYLPNVPQHEYHFTNYGYGYLAAFTFDPAHPTSLLYKKTLTGYELLGAMYTAPENASEETLNARVPLDIARWHLHVSICLPPGGLGSGADWTKFGPGGSIATQEACTAAGGKFVPHLFGWMIHVYPFESSPDKV